METLIHADIFFFITTIIVILIAIGVLWIIFYIIRILRNIDRLSTIFRRGGEEIADGIGSIAKGLKQDTASGKIWNKILSFFFPNFKNKKKSGKSTE